MSLAALRAPVLVVSPHPDDESLGCGGLIALLRREGSTVRVVMVTDGSGSHPNSPSWPAARLAALRRDETLAALHILGVAEAEVSFWMLPDRFAPMPGDPGFDAAVARAQAELSEFAPATLVIPSHCDAHGDHRAASEIWRRATAGMACVPRILEYVVWPSGDLPDETRRRELDISGVLARKTAAVAAHRSQHGGVVTDDPEGFCLPADLLARAGRDHEIFYEATP